MTAVVACLGLTRRERRRRAVFRLLAPLAVRTPFGVAELPAGRETDFMSAPWWLGWFAPVVSWRTAGPAALHDVLLEWRDEQRAAGVPAPMARREIDRVFRLALLAQGASPLFAWACWAGVRWQAWRTLDLG